MGCDLPFRRGYSSWEDRQRSAYPCRARSGRRVNPSAMSSAPFDRRLTPARADLAAEHLRGLVDAPRYVEGRAAQVVAASAPLRRSPEPTRRSRPRRSSGRPSRSMTRARAGPGRSSSATNMSAICRRRRWARRPRRPIGSRRCAPTPIPGPHQAAAAHGALARRAADDRGPGGRFRGLGGRALSLVAPSGGTRRARAGLRRGRRALSRDALSLGRPDVGRDRLLGPGPDGADRRRHRRAARQRHAGGGARRAVRHRRSGRRLRAAISCSGRAMSGSCAIPPRCFTPTAGT